MFAELDDSGDGEMSQVQEQSMIINFHSILIVYIQEEFIEGCMKDEDLVKLLSET